MSEAITSNEFSGVNDLLSTMESRFSENLNKINELGLTVVDSRRFTITEASHQTVAKYTCTYKNWQLIVKDKMYLDQPNGVLGIYEIECMNTGEVYSTYCNLKGDEIDQNRFVFLKGLMDNGVTPYLNELMTTVDKLDELFFNEGYRVKSDIKPEIQQTKGSMVLEKGEHTLFLKVAENEIGEVCLSVANSDHWSSPVQNRTLTKGKLFPLQGLEVQEVFMYVIDFMNEMETGTLLSAVPVHLFAQGYSWVTN